MRLSSDADEDEKGYLSRYTFQESIRDKATLPLHFESPEIKLKIDKYAIDDAYKQITNDPADILVKLSWVLDNQVEARKIVANSHERLRWLCGPEYLWACNEVLRRIAPPASVPVP